MRAQILGLTLVLAGVPGTGWAASPFDGAWAVNESCPPTDVDVKGFAWAYSGAVRNGALSAQYHVPSGVGSVKLQGHIAANGMAMLSAAGLVGSSDSAIGHVSRGTPYHFHVQAQFSASSGSGSRIEQRACDFTFTRQ